MNKNIKEIYILMIDELTSENIKLQNKINEAIEYIEYYFKKGHTKNYKQFDQSVLKILKGEDNDSKRNV